MSVIDILDLILIHLFQLNIFRLGKKMKSNIVLWSLFFSISYSDVVPTDDEDLLSEKALVPLQGSGDYLIGSGDYDDLPDDPDAEFTTITTTQNYQNLPELPDESIPQASPEVSLGLGNPGQLVNRIFKKYKTSSEPIPTEQPPIDAKTKLLISLILGISCLTCLTILILFSCHRYKKKDEGSYEIGGYYTPGKSYKS